MRKLATLATLVALTSAAPAISATSPLPGVWQGTLGAQPIRACFNQRDWGPYGAYYYMSHLNTIALEQPDGGGQGFVEGSGEPNAKSARWAFDKVGANELSGRWTQGSRSLPIQLKRMPLKLGEDDTPCGSMAFHQPRFEGVRTISKPASKDGVAYTRLILDTRGHFGDSINVETFALTGTSPAIQRINARLREPLSGNPPGWLDCVLMSFNSSPNGADHNESNEPAMFTGRWLVVTDHWDGFCGGAHPDASNVSRTFDLTTGAEVDIYGWLTPKAVERTRYEKDTLNKVLSPLKNLILAGWKPEDADCGDAIRAEDYWNAELTRSGIVFTPNLPHVVQACEEGFAVPFARLQPFLTPEGKKNVAALQAKVGRR